MMMMTTSMISMANSCLIYKLFDIGWLKTELVFMYFLGRSINTRSAFFSGIVLDLHLMGFCFESLLCYCCVVPVCDTRVSIVVPFQRFIFMLCSLYFVTITYFENLL